MKFTYFEIRKILPSALIVLALALVPEVLIFVFPGIFILFSRNDALFERNDPIKAISNTAIFSLSFWILTYWATMFIPLTLTQFFYLSTSLFIFLFFRNRDLLPETFVSGRQNAAALLILVLIVATRFVPFFDRITGSVGDMTQHNAMTRTIIGNNAFSSSYEPVMPFANFGEYPPGFHTIAAYLSLLGEHELFRATNFLSCFIYVLMNLALYLLLSRRFSKLLSMTVATLVLFLSHYPQFLNQWGSSTTALSTTFLFFSYYFLECNTEDKPWTPIEKIALGSVLAAGFLSHIIPPIGFAIYFAVHVLVKYFRREWDLSVLSSRNALVFVSALAFIVPFLLNFDFDVFERSKSVLISGHEQSLSKIFKFFGIDDSTLLKNTVGLILVHVFLFGPIFVTLSAGSVVFVGFTALRGPGPVSPAAMPLLADLAGALIAFCILLLLFINQTTPLYHLIHTERIHYFVLVPASLVLALALKLLSPAEKQVTFLVASLAISCATLWHLWDGAKRNFVSHYTSFKNDRDLPRFALRELSFGSYFAYALDKMHSSVTLWDIHAFEWIRRNIPRSAIFLVNPADGGALIPAIAERKIWNPHGMDLWHSQDLEKWRRENRPTHIYIGRLKSAIYQATFVREDLEKDRAKYRLIYDREGCSVFEIL